MDTQTPDNQTQTMAGALAQQDEIIAAFIDGLTAPTKRVDTHASTIILSGDDAYKIKRAVKYPYLDYHTLDLRRDACALEYGINKEISPELYVSVVSLYQDNAGKVVAAEDTPPGATVVETAIKMVRFDEDSLLINLARDDKLTRPIIEQTSRLIAKLHADARKVEYRTEIHGGGTDNINDIARDIINALTKQHEPDLTKPLARTALSLSSQIAGFHQQLNQRMSDGYIRQCHGDLHLGNVCIYNGKPTLFDAVEFNPQISNIDCLYDIAFFWMDLLANNETANANISMNTYLPYWDQYQDTGMIGLFMALRALVRAMVSFTRANMMPTVIERQTARRDARNYMKIAEECLTPAKPSLLVIGGLSGSGKTTLARAIAPELGTSIGAVHLRSDVIRKRLHNVDPLTPLSSEAYTKEASTAVYTRLLEQARQALRAGMPVIMDAVFLNESERADAAALAAELNVPFTGIWLNAPLETRLTRVDQRNNDASDADINIARAQESTCVLPESWLCLNSSGTCANLLHKALTSLRLDGHTVAVDLDQSGAA